MIGLRAKDIMNTDVLSVGIDWSIDQLADFFVENSISGAPVTSEDGKLLGVVSMTDIVQYKSMPGTYGDSGDTHEYYIHAPERKYSPAEIESYRIDTESLVTVGDIMTTAIFRVNEFTKIQDVADAMLRGRIHRVFVTRDETLVGIITTMDMLRAIKDL
jgi:CBS domain-containing protein